VETVGLKHQPLYMKLYGKLLEIRKKNFQFKKILTVFIKLSLMEVVAEDGLLTHILMLKRMEWFQ
jgi:hypothetical protein